MEFQFPHFYICNCVSSFHCRAVCSWHSTNNFPLKMFLQHFKILKVGKTQKDFIRNKSFFSSFFRNRVTPPCIEAFFTATSIWPSSWSTPAPILGSRITTDWSPSTIWPRIGSFNQDCHFRLFTKTCVKSTSGGPTPTLSKLLIWKAFYIQTDILNIIYKAQVKYFQEDN